MCWCIVTLQIVWYKFRHTSHIPVLKNIWWRKCFLKLLFLSRLDFNLYYERMRKWVNQFYQSSHYGSYERNVMIYLKKDTSITRHNYSEDHAQHVGMWTKSNIFVYYFFASIILLFWNIAHFTRINKIVVGIVNETTLYYNDFIHIKYISYVYIYIYMPHLYPIYNPLYVGFM